MSSKGARQKTIIIGAGPVGTLAAIYAANRNHDVEIYELRGGMSNSLPVIDALNNLFSSERIYTKWLRSSITPNRSEYLETNV